jgi:hypothetical protein
MAIPPDFFQKLKIEHLPFDLAQGDAGDGIRAHTDEDGAVTELQSHRHGKPGMALVLDPQQFDAQTRTFRTFDHSPGTSHIDGWTNFDGTPDTFDGPFIDGLPEAEYGKYVRYIQYVRWVRNELQEMAMQSAGPLEFCSFCGRHRTEVATLIAGPRSCICSGCVDMAHEIVHLDDPA